jgi:hypothetical protein
MPSDLIDQPAPRETTPNGALAEQLFLRWAAQNNLSGDVNNPEAAHYDVRGFWQQHPDFTRGPGQHLTDAFKQHGHKTFSAESNYSRGPWDGGRWLPGDTDDSYVQAPEPSHQRSVEGLLQLLRDQGLRPQR